MTLWNFTIDDTSPYLSYSPFVDGPNGWQTWYSQSQYNAVPDEAGRGDSYHVASQSSANVTFSFYGSGIALFGSANNTFNVSVDNIPSAFVNGTPTTLLYSNYSLTQRLHSVTLTTLPSSSNSSLVAFDFAIASSQVDINENPPSPLFYDNSNTASLLYSGSWSINKADGVPNSTISAPFHSTTESNASVSLSFTGGTAVAVRGLAGSENGLYSVSLNGSTSTFNGSSLWTLPDALLFFRAGLDPSATNQINITNMSAGSRLCLNSITVFQRESKVSASPSPTITPATSSGSINVSAIVGPIVGLLIFGILGVYILYRRRHRPTSVRVWTPRPFTQSRRRGGGTASSISSQPPSSANSDTHLSSPVTLFGGRHPPESPSETNLKMQTYLSYSPHNQSSPSVTKMSHSNVTPMDDTRFQADLLPSSPFDETTFISAPQPTPRRRPLPTIPVPSYYAALQEPELPPEGNNGMVDLMRPKTQETAPPQYEQ